MAYDDDDKLDDLIEEKDCWLNRFVEFFFIAIIAFVVYCILAIPCVDCYFQREIPRYEHRVFAKALILLVFVFIATAIIKNNYFKK